MNDISAHHGSKNETVECTGTSPIDLDSVLERLMGDTEFLKKMLVHFSDGLSSFMETIRNAIEKQDAELMARTAHQLKGAAANLSLGKIAKTASEINMMGRQSNFENAEEAFSELEQAVREYQAFYTQFVH